MSKAKHARTLKEFISQGQLRAMDDGCRGEEKDYFLDLFRKWSEVIETMPKTYEQDGKGDEAIVHLHYFNGGMDWYITEKDNGILEDTRQIQAFGLADLGYGGELGYISIVELVQNEVDFDLHWKPKTLREIKEKQLV